MYSTRCTSCGQLIVLKNEELEAAIAQTQAAKHSHYQMSCPKCRRPVKVPLKQLILKRPRPVPESLDGRGTESKEPKSGHKAEEDARG